MDKDARRIILGWIGAIIAIACCVAGFITLRNDQIASGIVFMATMFVMALYADSIFGSLRDREEERHLRDERHLRLVEDKDR